MLSLASDVCVVWFGGWFACDTVTVAGLHVTQSHANQPPNHTTPTSDARDNITWEEHCQTLPPYNYRIKVYSASTMHCSTPWGWKFCIWNMSEEWQRSVLCFNQHFNCIFKWKHHGVLVKMLWCFSEWCVKTRTVCIDFIKNKCTSRSVSVIKHFSQSNILMCKDDEQVVFLNILCSWRRWAP
jgi:hypothetical protein